jgi:hypothetical protein
MKEEDKSNQLTNKKITENENPNKLENRIKIDEESDLYSLPINTIKSAKIYDFYGKFYDKIFNIAIQMEDKNKKQSQSPQKNDGKKNVVKVKKKNVVKNQFKKQLLDKEIEAYSKIPLKTENNNRFKNNNIKSIDDSINNNKNYLDNFDIKADLSKSMVLSNIKVLKEFKILLINFEIKYNTVMGETLAIIGSINELGSWKRKKALKMTWFEGNIWKATITYNNYSDVKDFEYKFVIMNNDHIKSWEDGSNRKFIVSKIRGLIEPYIDKYIDSSYGSKTIISSTDYSLNQSFIYNIVDFSLTITSHWN